MTVFLMLNSENRGGARDVFWQPMATRWERFGNRCPKLWFSVVTNIIEKKQESLLSVEQEFHKRCT